MLLALTMVTVPLLIVVTVILYTRFSISSQEVTVRNTENVMEQTQASLEDYLLSMRRISDTVNFNVISEYDVSDPSLERELGLIYESRKDQVVSIALYSGAGSLLAAAPTAAQKTDPNVTEQEWFASAMDRIENMHFSTPHVQNLFDDATGRYHWVVSLSRAVETTGSEGSTMGVLLVDMNYSAIAQIMERINSNESHQYYYLCDSTGRLIYHPEKVLISEGLLGEDSQAVSGRTDGVYDDVFEGRQRQLVVRTIAYNGWKLVGVVPRTSVSNDAVNMRYFITIVLILMFMMLLAVNQLVSVRISRPIWRLNDSVHAYEAGEKPKIYIGGPAEIRHLGSSIQKSYEQIDALMQQIVREQNERRRSELDALQSQINPHFLYNTLDSITWMVEGGKNEEAVSMISALAKLLRISISKGHSIIPLRDEIQHAVSYMSIQRFRYKDRFAVDFNVAPETESCCCVKLIVQPILENAIYYGVGDMDEDEGGRIRLTTQLTDGQIWIRIEDNGLGMTSEEARQILTGSNVVHKHGSGVGLSNVQSRIQLIFGKEYGLLVESEPDFGTTVSIHFPAIPFTEENRKMLEEGRGS